MRVNRHTVDLEQRAYGPDSTREESEAIADRVSCIDERVLLMREMPVQSPFSINVMFDRLESLAGGWNRFSYVVDLSEAGASVWQEAAVCDGRRLILWHSEELADADAPGGTVLDSSVQVLPLEAIGHVGMRTLVGRDESGRRVDRGGGPGAHRLLCRSPDLRAGGRERGPARRPARGGGRSVAHRGSRRAVAGRAPAAQPGPRRGLGR